MVDAGAGPEPLRAVLGEWLGAKDNGMLAGPAADAVSAQLKALRQGSAHSADGDGDGQAARGGGDGAPAAAAGPEGALAILQVGLSWAGAAGGGLP